MTNVTYSELTSLINNSGLTVGEEYTVTDYPTFQPVLTARTTSELWRDGYAAGGYKLLYDPVSYAENTKYVWSSYKGYVYYLEDSTGTSAWCDWVNAPLSLTLQNSNNIKILPNIVSNQYRTPNLTVRDSSNLIIGGTTTMTFINCRNMTVGDGNTGTASDIDVGVIGDSNTNILVKNASIVNIGKNNLNVTVKNCNGVEVNDNNQDLNVSSGNNIIGSDNVNLDIQGENNQILNSCNTVTVTDDLNIVDESKFVDIDSAYNTVKGSNSVTLKDSVGNTIEDSRLVYLDSVNDNYIWATNYVNSPNAYTTPNGDTIQYNSGASQPFQSVKNRNQQKVGKININQLEEQKYQVDNAALVIDTDNNTRKNSTKSDDNYFINKDGLWNAEGISTDEYDVILVISQTDSQKCYVSGAGRYQNGATCEIGYSWIEPGYEAVFTDENGNVHEGPYTIIVGGNQKIYVTLTNATPQQVPFYIQDLSGSNNTVRIRKTNTLAETITVYYSTDGTSWNSMGVTSLTGITATCPANGKLYLRATEDHWGKQNYYDYISCSGAYKVGGNIMSLLVGENYTDATMSTSETYILSSVFYGSTNLRDASDLVLPRNVGDHCYNNLFYGCTALQSAPPLIATTLADGCYNGMFNGCTSLKRIVSYADDISATGCLTDWVNNVAQNGDFYKLGSAVYTSGTSGIPTGWNVHNRL